MDKLKKIFGILFKILLAVILLIAITAGGLFIWHYATIQSPDDFLPPDFLVYLKVDSIKTIYDNVIDLRAADVVFSSSPDLKSIYGALMEFKSNELTRNWLFSKLLDVRTDLVITEDFTPILVFDPGIISLPTRLIPVLNILIQIEGVNYSIIKKGKITLYNYQIGTTNLYFSFRNNLIFFSTKEESILTLYTHNKNHTSLKYNDQLTPLKAKVKAGGFAEIYLNTEGIISTVAKNNADLQKLVEEVIFNSLSAVSFTVSNENISLNAYTSLTTENVLLKSFLSYKPAGLQVLKYLPASTNLYSTLNFKSFREILDIILFFKGRQMDKMIKDIDNAGKLLLGMGIDELLFDWIGAEAGLFTVNESQEPVIFIKIGDANKWKLAWNKLMQSAFFDEEANLVLDNILIKKITFPPFIENIVQLFVKGLNTPYFIELGDFVFFSMNAEVLALTANHYKEEKLLIKSQVYKTISQDTSQNANLFLYYDLNTKLPDFLASRNLVTDLLKLYEKGLLSIQFNETEIHINIAATGVAGDKTAAFPGYPKRLQDAAAGDVICRSLEGNRKYKLVYLTNHDQLIIQDLIDERIIENSVEKNSALLITANTLTGKNEIFVFSQAGTLYKFDNKGNTVPPFPQITDFKNSFPPVDYNNRLVFYAAKDKGLYFMEKDGSGTSRFNFEFTKHLLAPPVFSGTLAAFAPKSVSSEIYLTDSGGNIREGWPQLGGGISYCSPLIIQRTADEVQVAFLTQAGILNLWSGNGESVTGFPVDLEGVYYQDPVAIAASVASSLFQEQKGKAILTLSEEGMLTLVSLAGEILKQKSMEELKGRESRIALFDFDKDGAEEIFIYGASNYITGLGKNFESLPGFPVKGSKRPYFEDLNYDGLYEMITGSFDGNVYAYTLNK